MHELSTNETTMVTGGGFSGWAIAALAAGIVFILGCFNGYTNPAPCN